jgi:hypothetical protein
MMDAMGSPGATPGVSERSEGPPVTAREAVDNMVQAGFLDDLMRQVDAGDLQLTGEGRVPARTGQAGAGGRTACRAERPSGH